MVVPGRTCAGPGGLAEGHQLRSRSASRGRSTRIIRRQEFDLAEPVRFILAVWSKSSLWFILKSDRPPIQVPSVKARGTRTVQTYRCALAFLAVPYRASQSDRCLVITTCSSLSAPFHGADAGSNPAGDANTSVNVYGHSSHF